jgi:predicted ABC-type transport system involved in lysophospholipase L1 biosynthesis ATPase subunit
MLQIRWWHWLADDLDEQHAWAQQLSGGEQQRVAIARVHETIYELQLGDKGGIDMSKTGISSDASITKVAVSGAVYRLKSSQLG